MLIWRVLRGYQLSSIAEAMLVHDCVLNCNGNAGIGARIQDNFAIRCDHFIGIHVGGKDNWSSGKNAFDCDKSKSFVAGSKDRIVHKFIDTFHILAEANVLNVPYLLYGTPGDEERNR